MVNSGSQGFFLPFHDVTFREVEKQLIVWTFLYGTALFIISKSWRYKKCYQNVSFANGFPGYIAGEGNIGRIFIVSLISGKMGEMDSPGVTV